MEKQHRYESIQLYREFLCSNNLNANYVTIMNLELFFIQSFVN